MEILKKALRNNPNIGLLLYTNNKFCLIPKWLSEKDEKEIKETLKVEVIRASVLGTDLLGVFCAGNSSHLIIPELIFEEELKELRELERFGVQIHTLSTQKTALGNLIAVNDKALVLSDIFSEKEKEEIKEIFSLPYLSILFDDVEATGSCISFNSERGIITPGSKDEQLERIERELGIKLLKATVNFGQPYISSGLVLNDNGFIVGQLSTGIEISEIDNFLRGYDE